MLERLARIARDGPEAPRLRAGRGVVGGDVAAHAVLGAAVADDHLVLDHARRAGDGVLLFLVGGLHLPRHLAGAGVERDQASVDRADVDLALPHRDAAVDHVAARPTPDLSGDLGVVLPEPLTGGGVDRVHFAPRRGEEHHAVDDDRRRFMTAIAAGVVVPRQAQLAHVLIVDLIERREALLAVGASVREPVAGFAVGGGDARAVDLGGGVTSAGRRIGRRRRRLRLGAADEGDRH